MTGIQDRRIHEQAEIARRAALKSMGRLQRSWERAKQPLREFAFEYVFRNPYQFSVPGEIGIYSERRNLVSIVWMLIAELGMFALSVLAVTQWKSSAFAWVFTLVGVASLGAFTYALLEWFVTRLFISDRRMYEITGFFSVKVAVLPLSKVTDMTYTQSFLGKVFRYGDVRVETAGQDQALSHISFLRRPEEVYKVATALALGKEWKRVTRVLKLRPDVPADLAVDDREAATAARLAEEGARSAAEAERIKGENERLKVEQARWELQDELDQVRSERRKMQKARLDQEAELARQQGVGRPADKQARTDRLVHADEKARLSELSASEALEERKRLESVRRQAEQDRHEVEQRRAGKEEQERKKTAALGSIGGFYDPDLEKMRKGVEDAHAEEEKDQLVVERHRQADEWSRVLEERGLTIDIYKSLAAERRRLELEQMALDDPSFEIDPDEDLAFIEREEEQADKELDQRRREDRRAQEEQRRFEVERDRTVIEKARVIDLESED